MVRKMSVPSMELTESDGPNTQLCAVMDGIGEISVKRALIPEPSAGEVRVKVKWVGICGSDVEVFRGASMRASQRTSNWLSLSLLSIYVTLPFIETIMIFIYL